jgi:hypothetical protein
MLKNSYFISGLVALLLSLILYFVAIPLGISAPSNVSKIVLSPVFWPQVLSVLLGITGIALMLSADPAYDDDGCDSETCDDNAGTKVSTDGSFKRLFWMGVLMIAYTAAIPKLGLVWASMIAFVALSILIKSTHPRTAVVAAVIIPLVLYLFFAHVAGMSIPQGEFLRLP